MGYTSKKSCCVLVTSWMKLRFTSVRPSLTNGDYTQYAVSYDGGQELTCACLDIFGGDGVMGGTLTNSAGVNSGDLVGTTYEHEFWIPTGFNCQSGPILDPDDGAACFADDVITKIKGTFTAFSHNDSVKLPPCGNHPTDIRKFLNSLDWRWVDMEEPGAWDDTVLMSEYHEKCGLEIEGKVQSYGRSIAPTGTSDTGFGADLAKGFAQHIYRKSSNGAAILSAIRCASSSGDKDDAPRVNI